MADIKWIKITVDMFDNRKIKHLRRLPEGNSIVLIWVMLLTMAGRCNAGGMIFLTENICYTPKMLADELGFEENTVLLALDALERLGMVSTVGNTLRIDGWEEHQNIDGMEKIKEQTRKRVAAHRERQKQKLIGESKKCVYCGGYGDTIDHVIATANGGADTPDNIVCSCLHCNMQKNNREVTAFLNDRLLLNEPVDIEAVVTNDVLKRYVRYDRTSNRFVTLHALHETLRNATDIEKDIEIEKDIDIENNKTSSLRSEVFVAPEPAATPQPEPTKQIPYAKIQEMYNRLCTNMPKCTALSEMRRKAIRARFAAGYKLEDFEQMFSKAAQSSFLNGANDRNFMANFDWLIKDANMAKVLSGNYEDRAGNAYGRERTSGNIFMEMLREEEERQRGSI